VLVLGALIGGFVLLTSGDDEDGVGDRSAVDRSGLTERLTKRDAGLSLFYPTGWRRSAGEGIINLESPDRCVAMALSSPVDASLWNRLFADSVAGLRDTRGAQIGRTQDPVVVGSAPTRTAIAALRSKKGTPVTVRLSVSRGRRLAHILQVVTRAPTCEESATQSRAIIESIEYTR